MADRSRRRGNNRGGRRAAPRRSGPSQRWLFGGLCLLVVIVIAVGLRYGLQRDIPVQLQGAIGNHYTRGPEKAAVVIKEFSDYT